MYRLLISYLLVESQLSPLGQTSTATHGLRLVGAGEVGAQVYFISPLIEESEALDLKNAVDLQSDLQAHFGEQVTVDLLHGKMKNDEKDAIMQAFKERKRIFWFLPLLLKSESMCPMQR